MRSLQKDNNGEVYSGDTLGGSGSGSGSGKDYSGNNNRTSKVGFAAPSGGGKRQHRDWYSAMASTTRGRDSGEGSEEDMVPMGKIQVRRDVEWDAEGGGGGER